MWGHQAESSLRRKWRKKRLVAKGGKKGTGHMTRPQNSVWICRGGHNNEAKKAHLQALPGLAHSPFESNWNPFVQTALRRDLRTMKKVFPEKRGSHTNSQKQAQCKGRGEARPHTNLLAE